MILLYLLHIKIIKIEMTRSSSIQFVIKIKLSPIYWRFLKFFQRQEVVATVWQSGKWEDTL